MALTDDQAVQIAQLLEDKFFPHVPRRVDASTGGWTETQHRTDRLSKSLAAFAVRHLTAFSEADAAATIIDGFGDNGIDALCFDRIKNQLVLVQAKFSSSRTPNLADTVKFTDGVKDLYGKRFEKFNEAFQLRLPDVLRAFDQHDLKIRVVLAHIGGELSRPVVEKLQELLMQLNANEDRVTNESLNGDDVYAAITAQFDTPIIDDVVRLHDWVISPTTPRILYGQVAVGELSTLFRRHERYLFSKNIRNYVGSNEVKDAIARTLREEPELLVHLNNGLTVTCRRFVPFPPESRECERVRLENMSIVNGAQTVGTIAVVSRDIDLATSSAKVQLTVIESSGDAAFENRVTQARNTQNQVRPSDFAAQDANQNRLRRELAVLGIEYHYKATESHGVSESSNVLLEEAAFALACFSGRVEDVVILRKSSGQLSDPSTPAYNQLFSESLTGAKLYRKVVIFRLLNQIVPMSLSVPQLLIREKRRSIGICASSSCTS